MAPGKTNNSHYPSMANSAPPFRSISRIHPHPTLANPFPKLPASLKPPRKHHLPHGSTWRIRPGLEGKLLAARGHFATLLAGLGVGQVASVRLLHQAVLRIGVGNVLVATMRISMRHPWCNLDPSCWFHPPRRTMINWHDHPGLKIDSLFWSAMIEIQRCVYKLWLVLLPIINVTRGDAIKKRVSNRW